MNKQHDLLIKTFGDKAFVPFTEQQSKLIEDVKELLDGIDKEQNTETGWWETSGGAKFGKDKLDKLVELIKVYAT